MIFTGTGVEVYRLASAKSAIRLEAKGIKVTKRSIRAMYARALGLSPRASHAEVIAAIDAVLARLVPQAQAEGGIRS